MDNVNALAKWRRVPDESGAAEHSVKSVTDGTVIHLSKVYWRGRTESQVYLAVGPSTKTDLLQIHFVDYSIQRL